MKQLREQIDFINSCISELEGEMRKVPQDGHMYQYFKRRRDGLAKVRHTLYRVLNIAKLLLADVI